MQKRTKRFWGKSHLSIPSRFLYISPEKFHTISPKIETASTRLVVDVGASVAKHAVMSRMATVSRSVAATLFLSLLICMLRLVFVHVPIWAQESSVQNSINYRTENGLISNDVVSVIFVESTNSIWLGTDKGVSRFDGTWRSYSNIQNDDGSALFPPGDVNVLEYSLEGDSLWAATSLGYVARWDRGNQLWETVIIPPEEGETSAIHALLIDGTTIWIGSDAGLLKYDVDAGEDAQLQPTCDEDLAVYAIAQSEDRLWLGTNAGLFYQQGASCWEQQKTKINGQDNPPIISLLWLADTTGAEKSRNLWVTFEDVIARFDPEAAKWLEAVLVSEPVQSLTSGTVGDVWVATMGNGAINFSDIFSEALPAIDFNSSVSERRLNDDVRDIAIDSDGGIWFATPSGVTRYLQRNLWTNYAFSVDRLSGSGDWDDFDFSALSGNLNDIRDLLTAQNGDIWIATGGGVRLQRAAVDGQTEELYIGNGSHLDIEGNLSEAQQQNFANALLPENTTVALAEDSRGTIWAGFFSDGIAAYINDAWVIPAWSAELPLSDLSDLLAVDERIWIGVSPNDSNNTGLAYVDITIPPIHGEPVVVEQFTGYSVDSFVLDKQKRLWVATYRLIEGNEFEINVWLQSPDVGWVSTYEETVIAEKAPFVRVAIDPLTVDGLWLAVSGRGLLHWDSIAWRNVDWGEYLPTTDLRSLYVDPEQKDLWVGSGAGVTRYDGYTWETFFRDGDALVSTSVAAISKIADRQFLFGANGRDGGGLSLYSLTDVTPPWIRIGSIIADTPEKRFLNEAGETVDQFADQDDLTLELESNSKLTVLLEFGDLQTPSEQLQVYYRSRERADASLETNCLIDDEWQLYRDQFSWPAETVGEHLLEFCARDQAFNYTLIKSLPVIVKPSSTFDLSRIGLPDNVGRRTLLTLLLLSAVALLAFGYVGIDWFRQRRRSIEALQRGYNPYVSGEPIRSEDMFFGRQGLLQRIIDTLHNNSIMIHGERRIGKTTMLYQLSNTLVDVADPEYWFVPIYIDLEGTPAEMFFHLLIEEIVHKALTLEDADTLLTPEFDKLSYHDIPSEAYTDRRFTRDLRTVIQTLQEYGENKHPTRQLRVILLMDEMDVLSQYDHLIQQQLRRIFMRDFAATLGAVVAGIQISREWDRVESPWFNLFNEIEIEPFGRDEAIDLLVEPVKGYYLYQPAALEMIVEYSDGRPFRIQQYALEAVTHMLADNRRQIRIIDVEVAHENIQNSGNLSHTDAGLIINTNIEDKSEK